MVGGGVRCNGGLVTSTNSVVLIAGRAQFRGKGTVMRVSVAETHRTGVTGIGATAGVTMQDHGKDRETDPEEDPEAGQGALEAGHEMSPSILRSGGKEGVKEQGEPSRLQQT